MGILTYPRKVPGDLGTLCTKLKHIIRTNIDDVYESGNPFKLFKMIDDILGENDDLLKNANECAKRHV